MVQCALPHELQMTPEDRFTRQGFPFKEVHMKTTRIMAVAVLIVGSGLVLHLGAAGGVACKGRLYCLFAVMRWV
jgi:hypothetical protein